MKCKCCWGTGETLDHRGIGEKLRLQRKRARVSLQSVADELDKSVGYISDLEHGRRNWSEDLVNAYKLALKQ